MPAILWRGRSWKSIVIIPTILLAVEAAGAAPAQPPVVAGYVRLRDDAKLNPAAQGELLLGELNCLNCHAAPAQARVFTKGAPDLSSAGARITPQYLRAFLADPHGTKGGTTMPDLLHGAPQDRATLVESLTQFLASQGGPIAPATVAGSQPAVARGHTLFHTIGCVACHAPEKKVDLPFPSVPLPDLAEKTTVDQLAAFLLDPIKVRPGGRMPNLHLSNEEARDLAVYLLRDQLENPQGAAATPVRTQGVKYSYYEEEVSSAAREKLEQLRPKSEGVVPSFTLDFPGRRTERFAVRYTSTIHIKQKGKYTFRTTSDDGSRLYIADKLVVDNDGQHGPEEKAGSIELKEGDQPITVTFYQAGAGFQLKVEWEGPKVKRQVISGEVLSTLGGRPMIPLHSETFVADRAKAQAGQQAFAAMGCVACHALGATHVATPAKPLAQLNPDAADGCLGMQPGAGRASYDLSDDQRQAIKAAMKDVKELDKPLEPKEQVVHLLAAFNCYGCHVRDGVGGPGEARKDFFTMTIEADMGDEGRLPPRLSGVGAKLKPEAINQIVFEGKLHVRPEMATRMPSFSKEKAGEIVEALGKADGPAEEKTPEFTGAAAKDGRQLIGTKGVGCINCHGINGVKSLGMPAPDLGLVGQRLRPGWFHQLLVNPAHINPGTRMPQFWAEGQVAFPQLGGGTMDAQIDSIWSYLSLGDQMTLPIGLQPTSDELIPADAPIVHRTQMAGVGNRTVLAGFPEGVHVAFDADVVRMAKAWKGRFFDAQGMWENRGGKHLEPLGSNVIDLPPGPAFALLDSPQGPWPDVKPKERNIGGHFKGYELDKQERPIFHYVLEGIDVYEQPIATIKKAGPVLVRSFRMTSSQSVTRLYFLAVQGHQIESKSQNEWTADGKLTVRLLEDKEKGNPGPPLVRDSLAGKQLLFPVTFQNGSASFSVELSW